MNNEHPHKEVIDDYQSVIENKRTLYRKIIFRIIRMICPMFVSLGWIFGVRTFNTLGLDFSYGIVFLIVYFGILTPAYCFIYGLNVIKNEKNIDSYVAYNPIMAGISCICISFNVGGISFVQLLLCGWIAIWTYLPVRIHNSIIKNANINQQDKTKIECEQTNSQSNITDCNIAPKKRDINFSKCFVNDKNYSVQMKRSILKIIRLVAPIYFPFIGFIVSEVINFIFFFMPGNPTIIGEILLWFVLFPASCFFYGISVAKYEKRKVFFALYYPIVSLVSWLQAGALFGILAEPIARNLYLLSYVIIAFFFFTLLPVWIYNYKHKSKANKEASREGEQ